ncbi:hypothetical protein ACOMHN_010587 [Nucella lapillus]
MKAYLKAQDGSAVSLGPRAVGVDYQHAVIEFCEAEECLVLQDLNTAQGTYVNEVRVQNAAVRLAPGDRIRFGYNGLPYEVQLEQPSGVTCPPVQQKQQAWNRELTILNESPVYSATQNQHALPQHQQQLYGQQQQQQPQAGPQQALPFLLSSGVGQSAVWTQPTPQAPLPRPPLRSRPLSAGSGSGLTRRSTFDIPRSFHLGSNSVVVGGTPSSVRQGGWVNGSTPRGDSGTQGDLLGRDFLQQQAQEKEQRLIHLTEEVTRLRSFEFESIRKDQLVQQLQQQISDLKTKLQQEPSIIMGCGDGDASQRIKQLEAEVSAKNAEVTALKGKLTQIQTQGPANPIMLRQELNDRMKEIANLRSELERVKKDKSITSGLVTQMQRDMSNKDLTISKLTREIEVLKKDLRERDKLLSNANIKVNKVREACSTTKVAGEGDVREKELISLRQRHKVSDNKITDQFNLITSLREELENLKTSVFEEKDARKRLQSEADSNRSQFLDVQRTERVVRVDLEQTQKRSERFRSRVLQTTFSTPGVKAPEKEISDNELIQTLKKLLSERGELVAQITTLKQDVKNAAGGTDQLKDEAEKLRESLQESVDRLKESGRLSGPLKQEVSLIRSLIADSNLLWMRDMIADVFGTDLDWQEGIETALLKCGVNCKLSTESPAKHIELLYAKWESALSEKDRLVAQIAELESHHQDNVNLKLDAQRNDLDNRLMDAVEKARLEGEEKLNRAIDEIRGMEEEKLQNAIAAEKRRLQELETTVQQLRQSLMERQDEDRAKLEQASELVSEVEQYKLTEAALREQLTNLEERMKTEVSQLQEEKEELTKKNEEDVESHKEQVRQHAVTICSMEERLSKLTKRNKDNQEEKAGLKKSNTALKAELDKRIVQRPAVVPKPKVIVQRPTEEINALDHVVTLLRQENGELKKSATEQQDIIAGLRRDLTGASARLSDISGEMSESQKRDMEKHRDLLCRRDAELTELRQQMVKLSKIIDKQKEDITSLQEELSKEKSMSMKYRTDLEQQSSRLTDAESRLKSEKDEQKKQTDLLDQEGRITSELVSAGAQCKGERHGQIIARQREALAELRGRVKTLEQARPPLPTQDQALHQVVMLKKELAEMRANQALAEDRVLASRSSLDRQVGKARGLISPGNSEADMERSAHRETMETLEKSEATFMSLLRAVSDALDLEEGKGLRALAHLPPDERDALGKEREDVCEFIAGRIEVLKERISRKDELLQGYENDLAKLRKSQEIASKTSVQVDSLAHDVRSRTEEAQYLRETLNRTRDRLNQEKRLNTAIKQKKTFHLENERAHLRPQSAGRPKSQEEQGSGDARKKAQREIVKRKNYEIRTLKGELCDKEQALYDREKRLLSLETTLGPDSLETAVES